MTSASSSCDHGGLRVWLRVVEAADVLLEVDMVDGRGGKVGSRARWGTISSSTHAVD